MLKCILCTLQYPVNWHSLLYLQPLYLPLSVWFQKCNRYVKIASGVTSYSSDYTSYLFLLTPPLGRFEHPNFLTVICYHKEHPSVAIQHEMQALSLCNSIFVFEFI